MSAAPAAAITPQEVHVSPRSPDPFRAVLRPEMAAALGRGIDVGRRLLDAPAGAAVGVAHRVVGAGG